MIKKCKRCTKEFTTQKAGQKFCGTQCSESWQKANLSKFARYRESGFKVCNKCKKRKPLSDFRAKGPTRVHPYCAKCFNLYMLIRWHCNKIRAIAHLGGKCVDCGKSFHPAIFQFHHRTSKGKEAEWSQMRNKSWDNIKKELDKCILLCSGCHTLRGIKPEIWAAAIKMANTPQ
jgi:hypothetical protein